MLGIGPDPSLLVGSGHARLPFEGMPSKILYAETYYVHYAHTGDAGGDVAI